MYNNEIQQLMINYKVEHASYLDTTQPDQRMLAWRPIRSEAEKIHEESSGLQTTVMPEVFAHGSSTESTNSVQPFLQRQDGSVSGWRFERERDA